MKSCGVLMPVFSLPSEGGIGCFSKDAFHFIDWLAEAGQTCWQILPMNPAGSWNSPYQPLSCFAGDPVYISPDALRDQDLISEEEYRQISILFHTENAEYVNYPLVRMARRRLLHTAYSRFKPDSSFDAFCRENSHWLDDYALFIALHEHFEDQSWAEWPEGLRRRDPMELARYQEQLCSQIQFHIWTQYEFSREWQIVVRYAHQRGIDIIGDIPIYVSYDSADCWAHSELFRLTPDFLPSAVSGCPPDAFSPTGQRWGNPLYDWSRMKKDHYGWWMERIRQNLTMYDCIRIDHFRGLESYYSIPIQAETAMEGDWLPGPGISFFQEIARSIGDCRLIAEDLGTITPAVEKLIRQTGLPGMKVLQFAFDSDRNNPYLPENFGANCVVYTGTHDNDTTSGWYSSISKEKKRIVTDYLRTRQGVSSGASASLPLYSPHAVTKLLVDQAFRSPALSCIIPIQDYLLLDSAGRVNTPGTVGLNWRWRIKKAALSEELAAHIHSLAVRYGRAGITRSS